MDSLRIGVFYGDLRDGLPYGQGRKVFMNGDEYKGTFIAGQLTGQGVKVMANGDYIKGFFKNGQLNGRGCVLKFKTVSTCGQFIDGDANGIGIQIFPNKDKYVGSFKNNKKSGSGTMKFANGLVYDGSWKHDTMNGQGKMYFPNGNIYAGLFKNGKLEIANSSVYDGKTLTIDNNSTQVENEKKEETINHDLVQVKGTVMALMQVARVIATDMQGYFALSHVVAWCKGISTGDSEINRKCILGREAPGLCTYKGNTRDGTLKNIVQTKTLRKYHFKKRRNRKISCQIDSKERAVNSRVRGYIHRLRTAIKHFNSSNKTSINAMRKTIECIGTLLSKPIDSCNTNTLKESLELTISDASKCRRSAREALRKAKSIRDFELKKKTKRNAELLVLSRIRCRSSMSRASQVAQSAAKFAFQKALDAMIECGYADRRRLRKAMSRASEVAIFAANYAINRALDASSNCADAERRIDECAVCFEMTHGVSGDCNHAVCGPCMKMWTIASVHGRCPVCRRK